MIIGNVLFFLDVRLGAAVHLVHGVEASPRGGGGVDRRLGSGAGGGVDVAEGDPVRRAGRRHGQDPQAAIRVSLRGEDAGLQIAGYVCESEFNVALSRLGSEGIVENMFGFSVSNFLWHSSEIIYFSPSISQPGTARLCIFSQPEDHLILDSCTFVAKYWHEKLNLM